MYDKIDLRVPAGVDLHPIFLSELEERGAKPGFVEGRDSENNRAMVETFGPWAGSFWRPSQHYERVADLRPLGYPALLHMNCKRTKKPNHKLEFIETGDLSVSKMRVIGRTIFRDDPEQWGIMRADLTADVPVPVRWFKEHTFAQFKRTTRELGNIQPTRYQMVRKGDAETLYAGVKPNQLRIYNKTLERWARHQLDVQRVIRKAKKEASEQCRVFVMPDILSFEERYGYSKDKVITRVERQCYGRDLEKLELKRFADLKYGDILRPFDRIKFSEQGALDLSVETWGITDYLAGSALQTMVRDFGLNEVKRFFQRNVRGDHWKRSMDKYAPWIAARTKESLTLDELTTEYQKSTRVQLVA